MWHMMSGNLKKLHHYIKELVTTLNIAGPQTPFPWRTGTPPQPSSPACPCPPHQSPFETSGLSSRVFLVQGRGYLVSFLLFSRCKKYCRSTTASPCEESFVGTRVGRIVINRAMMISNPGKFCFFSQLKRTIEYYGKIQLTLPLLIIKIIFLYEICIVGNLF